jgi:hypothetical protein
MREMYIKYDVVVGFRLTGIRMGKGVVRELNYVSINDKSVRMTMTVNEFEEYQERLVNEVSEQASEGISEFGKYDVMLGYTLKSIIKGKGEISGLKFVSKYDKTDRITVTGEDLVQFKYYVNEMANC